VIHEDRFGAKPLAVDASIVIAEIDDGSRTPKQRNAVALRCNAAYSRRVVGCDVEAQFFRPSSTGENNVRAGRGTLGPGVPIPPRWRPEQLQSLKRRARSLWLGRALFRSRPTTSQRCLAIEIDEAGPPSAVF
jgi:hypothetical protein